jgi:arginine decarboxylase
LGIFLTGAYQEVMGSHHNLFGDPNEAVVRIQEGGKFTVEATGPGSSIEDMVRYAHYTAEELQGQFGNLIAQQAAKGKIDPQQAQQANQLYQSLAKQSTYLD